MKTLLQSRFSVLIIIALNIFVSRVLISKVDAATQPQQQSHQLLSSNQLSEAISPDKTCEVVVLPHGEPFGDGQQSIRIQLASEQEEGTASTAVATEPIFRLTGLGSNAPVDTFWSPDSTRVLLVIHHTKYDDTILLSRVVSMVTIEKGEEKVHEQKAATNAIDLNFVSTRLPILPAGGILQRFPTEGKPEGRSFRLDTIGIKEASWSTDSKQIAIRAQINVLDKNGSPQSPSYHYIVDYILQMPQSNALANNGGDVELKLVNVAFLTNP